MAEDRARARRWRGLSFRAVGSSAVNLPLGGLGLLSDEGHSPYLMRRTCSGVQELAWMGGSSELGTHSALNPWQLSPCVMQWLQIPGSQ